MRRSLSILLAAGAVATLPVASADAALRDVRTDVVNATDHTVHVRLWHDKTWRSLGELHPGQRLSNISDDERELTLWFDDCGQSRLSNPLIGTPSVTAQRSWGSAPAKHLEEGDSGPLEKDGLRFEVTRNEDTSAYKNFELELTGCPFADPVSLPTTPMHKHRKPPLRVPADARR